MKPIIEVKGLSKKYRLGEFQPYYTLRDSLAGMFRNPLAAVKGGLSKGEFWALKDINFEVQQGEVVGIIGRNGAGKSTLLKILSQITPPTEGEVILRGRVGSLLEVGTGFSPELTGRENIYLNGAILGMKRSEVRKRFDEIVAFSEVEKFLDTPLKRYSSGMYMRLAFAVAAHLEPEILIVDEVLAVGDAEFQKKCLGKMGEVAIEGRTVLFVSHNMGAVKELCKTAILLEDGTMRNYGSIEMVSASYLGKSISSNVFEKIDMITGINGLTISNIDVNKQNILATPKLLSGENLSITINYSFVDNDKDLCISFGVYNSSNNILVAYTHNHLEKVMIKTKRKGALTCTLELPYLTPGTYILSSQIWLDSRLIMKEQTLGQFNVESSPVFQNYETIDKFPSMLMVKSRWKHL